MAKETTVSEPAAHPTPGPQHELLHFLAQRGKDISPLLILTHNHPDPDCLASAVALAFLAEKLHGIKTRIAYGGIVGRVENQAMVRVLRLPVHALREGEVKRYEHVALVDTQPPFQNNPFPKNRKATLVVDHHPRNKRTDADLLVIDPTYGATSTLLTEAVQASGLLPPSKLSTALLYGIVSETQNLGREAGERDINAYLWLLKIANLKTLSHIQNPPRPRSFFATLSRAIQRAFVYKKVIGVHLGELPTPDLVAQMADFLLSHEGMDWSICTGRYHGNLHISLRTHNPRAEAGRLLKKLLGGGTRGGGHGMIAGGSVVLGEAPEEQWRKQEDTLTSEFFKALKLDPKPELEFPFYLA
jgi:nanoRNase/pAp phosphatase (c-di-AMP/oligoRNAs hydrolase)